MNVTLRQTVTIVCQQFDEPHRTAVRTACYECIREIDCMWSKDPVGAEEKVCFLVYLLALNLAAPEVKHPSRDLFRAFVKSLGM